MPDSPQDPSLDAQLRDVSVPEDFLARLKEAVVPSDEQIDQRLCGVSVPPLVLARLRMIPSDAAVDDALHEVVLPMTLTWRLRSIPASRRFLKVRRILQRASAAAALFLVVWTTLLSSLGALLTGIYRLDADEMAFPVIYYGPLTIEHELSLSQPAELQLTPTEQIASEPAAHLPFSVVSNAQPTVYVAAPASEMAFAPGPVAQWISLIDGGLRPMDDVVLLRYGVLGAPQYSDDVFPELESPQSTIPRGIEPPRVRGYDREFFLKHRIFPPLSPGASPGLRTLQVPLTMHDDSYRRAESLIRQNRWPSTGEIRVEDFIASQDYQFPLPAAGRLGIRTAAGPSPFGQPGVGLLQLGVQAGRIAKRKIPAAHFIIALDISTSMGRGDKLVAAGGGIRRLVEQMNPRDRVSLVVFAEEVVECVEDARQTDAAEIDRLLDNLQPAGGTNLAVGLQRAASLALNDSEDSKLAKRLVLITDSRAQMPDDTFAGVAEILAATAEANVKFCVIDASDREDEDIVLNRLAEGVGGDLRRANQERQVYATLLEWGTGNSEGIAAEVGMSIRFNPQTVAAYRLIGHEANAMAGITAATTVAEMRAGDAASALIEIWFQNSQNDDVGDVELHWRDPVSGKEQRLRQRISRLQFAPTFAEMQPSLQAAAIAAEAGELLRGSRELLREAQVTPTNTGGIPGLLAVAGDVHPQIAASEEFQKLIGLIEGLERLRPR